MKKILRIMSLLMTVMAALSCVDEIVDTSQEEIPVGEKVEMTFSASFDAGTRTTLVNGTEVWWMPRDCISINGDPFWATVDEPSPSSEFTGETTLAQEYHAVYSHSMVEWKDNEYRFYSDWWQWAIKDKMQVFLSAAECSDAADGLTFRSLFSYIKFTVAEESVPLTRVDVCAKGGEILALGNATVDFSGEEPVLVAVDDEFAKDLVSLCSETVMEPGDYYIAVVPGTFSEGLDFVFTLSDGRQFLKTISKEISLGKGIIQNIGEVGVPDVENLELERLALIDFYNAAGGDNWDDNTNWCSDRPVGEWYGVETDIMGHVTSLSFYGNNLVVADELPASMANLEKLNTLILLEGDFKKIPEVVRQFENLKQFSISGGAYTPLKCSIPEWIGELTNLRALSLGGDFPEIPEQITNLTQLKSLGITGPWTVGGDLGGKLPDLSKLEKLESLSIIYYDLGIEIPEWIYDMTSLEYLILNNLGLTGTISEKISNLKNIIDLNMFTNKLEGPIPAGITSLTRLRSLALYENNLTGTIPEGFSNLKDLVSLWLYGNRLSGRLPDDFEQNPNYGLWGVDQNVMLQQAGYVLLPASEAYVSSDYSADGQVLTLQKATVGDGVDIVLLGDGFVDKDMGENGKFEQAMYEALEYMFSLEPMTSYRDYFNVYAVKAVSQNDRFGQGYHTALDSYFGEPPFVSGNIDKAFEYALKAPVKSADDLTVAVILSANVYAGATMMDMTNDSAVSYVGMARDPYNGYSNSFGAIFIHEVVGHAFAKLGDEYVYKDETYPLSGDMDWRNQVWIGSGYSANLDITSDPDQIRWGHILKDERYSSYTGIVEGGDYYAYGIWRPEDKSMMRNNDPYFNAPSREAIVKRIMELAGDEYSFEKFAEKDIHNPLPYTKANHVEQPFQPTAPPVIINGSWRDAVGKNQVP